MSINIACHNFDCIHNQETLCMLDMDNKTITINSCGKCESYTMVSGVELNYDIQDLN